MEQVNFRYVGGGTGDGFGAVRNADNDWVNSRPGSALTVSIFADRAHVRDTLREDAEEAGFRLGIIGTVADLLDGEERFLGGAILLDCPIVDGAILASLAQSDVRLAQIGVHLVVSTNIAALDDVFGCLDQSNAQILVDPTRSERIIALGQILAKTSDNRVRELSADDRVMLLRLTEQVGKIAERLERLPDLGIAPGKNAHGGAFRLESPAPTYGAQEKTDGSDRLNRTAGSSLPDAKIVRQIIRHRHLRGRFFGEELFADPAWDILLDLTAARAEQARVSVTSLCIAAGVPPTTALRWISQMKEIGLVERVEDETDKRRAFITLSEKAADGMARFFAELGKGAQWAV